MTRPRLALLACLIVSAWISGGPRSALATGGATQLSIMDWVNAQGSCQDLDSDTICGEDPDDLYVPPTPNFIGWFSPSQARLSSIDYAGVAARYILDECGIDLGTSHRGSVTARDVGDGQALVSVQLHTDDALAWVADDPTFSFDFANTPLLFGARPADVCLDVAEPSVVDLSMNIEYYAPVDEPLVDIGTFEYAIRKIMFRAHGTGLLTAGSSAMLTVNQTGIFETGSQASSFDGFPVEFINLHPTGD